MANPTAKLSLLKRELATLIEIVKERQRLNAAFDYAAVPDDLAGEIGDEHEVVNGILSMLEASYADTFEAMPVRKVKNG
jgi:hypothetical protein